MEIVLLAKNNLLIISKANIIFKEQLVQQLFLSISGP